MAPKQETSSESAGCPDTPVFRASAAAFDSGVAEIFEALSKAFAPPAKIDPIQWLEQRVHRSWVFI